jgi:hypothetical protein
VDELALGLRLWLDSLGLGGDLDDARLLLLAALLVSQKIPIPPLIVVAHAALTSLPKTLPLPLAQQNLLR